MIKVGLRFTKYQNPKQFKIQIGGVNTFCFLFRSLNILQEKGYNDSYESHKHPCENYDTVEEVTQRKDNDRNDDYGVRIRDAYGTTNSYNREFSK